ncbi:galactonate dehydratase [Streptomyces sp. enrichment culture]|uniref:galactonate dehydratase n=1 Tax=Streptomyces sp. enrichment culture TaxID=1795815 RepID=UPI003F5706DE
MKITALRTYLVGPRWCLVRIDTDEGITGWGEPVVVAGRGRTLVAAVEELSHHLTGQDPMRIEEHWQVLATGGRYRGGALIASAVAGIDQALWDIAGKALGVPVWQLLGGHVRDWIRVYSRISGGCPTDVAEQAAARRAEGFTAVKVAAHPRLGLMDTPEAVHDLVERVATVRAEVGDRFDIVVDLRGRLTLAMARRVLPLLEEYLPVFVEEPVCSESSDRLGDIVRFTGIPVAAGEHLCSRWDFGKALQHGIAVAQPDLSLSGGISEVRRIAAVAETYRVPLAPQCPRGPVALAACLQVGFATADLLIQEMSPSVHDGSGSGLLDHLTDRSVFQHHEGHVRLLTGPGLGIELDAEAVERAARTA